LNPSVYFGNSYNCQIVEKRGFIEDFEMKKLWKKPQTNDIVILQAAAPNRNRHLPGELGISR
jgi:hypothetical protein